MTTATRPNRATLGHRLAAKVQKPRRTVRPKRPASRPTQLEAEAQRIIKAVEVKYVERQLGKSHLGREFLRLTDAQATAGFKEQLAGLTLGDARRVDERARTHHSNVCNRGLHQQFDSAHFALKEAEAALYKATRLHAAAVDAHELVDVELRLLEQTRSR